MKSKQYYFKPRLKDNYNEGYKGYRTLIVGASIPCTQNFWKDCSEKDKCASEEGIRNVNCHCYASFNDDEYHALSNSNEIELDSYIEGHMSPTFSSFTKYMLDLKDSVKLEERAAFWDSVAFYNYQQSINVVLNVNECLPKVNDSENNYNAFVQVLDELAPQIVYVWYKPVRDIILSRNIKGLKDICCIDAYGTTVYCFTYNIKSDKSNEEILSGFKCNKHYSGNRERRLLQALIECKRSFLHYDREFKDSSFDDDELSYAMDHCFDQELYIYLINEIEERLHVNTFIEKLNNKYNLKGNDNIITNLYLGNVNHRSLHSSSFCELSYFGLGFPSDEDISFKPDADILVFYLTKYTWKNELEKILSIKPELNGLVMLIANETDCRQFESEIKDSERIDRVIGFNDYVCIVLKSASPNINFTFESLDNNCQIDLPYTYFNAIAMGSKLLPQYYYNLRDKIQDAIDKHKEKLDKLVDNGLIFLEIKDNKYPVYRLSKPGGLIIPYGKKKMPEYINIKKDIFNKSKMKLLGWIFLYLTNDKDDSHRDLGLMFDYEEKDVNDDIRYFRKACKKCIKSDWMKNKENNHDYEKYFIDFLLEIKSEDKRN